ncbi:unnamed protein product [Adineta ricciae]|uniref:DYW domain-containing protein n=1 Tax=Adineta ricciae TaxID=249248 RepID=A0A815KU86_ADIRI|nr:unnamed protein product [Adineta ricciae]
MSNRLVYVNFKFKTLFILRQQIPCISSTSPFSTRPRNIDPGQQMKVLNDKKQFKQTIELFERKKKKNKDQLSSFIIDQALKACVQVRDFRRGQDIHQLVQHRLSADSSLVKSLIHFYMQCHDMNTAESLFHISTNKTVYVCSVMMKGYIENGKPEKAIEIFKGVDKPDAVLITLLFKACAQVPSEESLNLVKNIWKRYQNTPLLNSYVLTSLIDALMKCGDAKDAEAVFNGQSTKVLPMYGAMMKGYIDDEMPQKAIDVFQQVNEPDAVLITLLFKACAQAPSEKSLDLVKSIWKKYQKTPLLNSYVLTSLIDALMKCGDVKEAEMIFNRLPTKVSSVFLHMCHFLFAGYIKHMMPEKAIEVFKGLEKPDTVLIILLCKACAQVPSEESLNLVKNIWKQYQNTPLLNPYILTSLIDALMKCGDVKDAEAVFNGFSTKVSSMHGAMMKGYIDNEMPQKAIDLFMQANESDEILVTLLFKACAQVASEESLNLVKIIWKQYNAKIVQSESTLTSLINALMKCGDVNNSETVFAESRHKSLSMYGAMMKGYIENEMSEKAIDLFKQVEDPREIIITLLFNACAQLPSQQSLSLIKTVWKKYQNTALLHEHALTALIDAFMRCGDVKGAETIFHKLPHKVLPMYGAMMKDIKATQSNFVIYLLAINASAQVAIASECQAIVDEIPQHIVSNSKISNALIDMWGKVGCVQKAEQVFTNLSSIDQVGYASMIHAYGINGMGVKAVELFHKVPRSLLADSTYVCVLNACSHAGLVDQARSIFSSIEPKTEKHYAAMMDCLSRGSLFDEAQQLIDQYELHHPPSPVMYSDGITVSCKKSEKQTVGRKHPPTDEQALSSLTRFDHISHSVTCESVWIDRRRGQSVDWTVVNGELYQFLAHDRSHPRSAEIYVELEKISRELIEHGHEYDSSWITRPLAEDETIESVLCGHSEKLAIAWNFVANADTTFIQITKNLRVCGDCHQATKLIAAIRRCHIVVRDANRIHHFDPDGHCSCNDYF